MSTLEKLEAAYAKVEEAAKLIESTDYRGSESQSREASVRPICCRAQFAQHGLR